MTRVTIFVFFLVLFVIVLNLRDQENLAVSNSYFNFNEYKKSYDKEVELIAHLNAPKVVEKVEEEVQMKEEPKVVLTTESQTRGQALYGKCITCHGKHGMGKKSQKAPKIAGQYDWYIYDKIVSMQKGIWENKVMYPYIKKLSDQDVKDLAAFLSAYKW